MKISAAIVSSALIGLVWNVHEASSFVPVNKPSFMSARRRQQLYTAEDDDNLNASSSYEPYFEMQQIPTATTGVKLDRIVECADHGEMCDVQEMMDMMNELERLNLECSGEMSRECSLDAVAARNVLKVALAANVAMEGALEECSIIETMVMNDDPYADMYELHDECMSDKLMHPIPTATYSSPQTMLDHIVECAENGQCNVEEMAAMIDELEDMNMDCGDDEQGGGAGMSMSRECSLDAVEARNILKVALASRVNAEAQQRMRR